MRCMMDGQLEIEVKQIAQEPRVAKHVKMIFPMGATPLAVDQFKVLSLIKYTKSMLTL